MKIRPNPTMKLLFICLLVISNSALLGAMSHTPNTTPRSAPKAPENLPSNGSASGGIIGTPGKAELLRTVDVNTLPSASQSAQSSANPSVNPGQSTAPAASSTTPAIGGPTLATRASEISHISSSPSVSAPSAGGISNAPITTGPSSVSILAKFDALNQTKACKCVPPDGGVAAGPSNVVEMINTAEGIFTKQGTLTNFFTLNAFYNTPDFLSDPKVMYDAQSGRFFASILDVGLDLIYVAVSNSSSPFVWKIYSLLAPGSNVAIADQPILGVSDDKVAISTNDFTVVEDRFGRPHAVYLGAQFWILSKPEMLAGLSGVDQSTFGPSGSPFNSLESVHPVQSLSSTTTMYMISAGGGEVGSFTSVAQLVTITGVPPGIVTVNPVVNLPVSGISVPPKGLQPGTTSLIDTGDHRVLDAAWSQGILWFGLDTSCTPVGDNVTRSCIRLTQMDTTSNRVLQDMNFSAKGMYYFYPSLRIDGNGGLDLIFGYSSQTNSTCCYPSLAVTGQAPSDPVNSLIQSRTIVTGSANDTTGILVGRARYGDYFGAGVDPSDPSLVWVEGEYHNKAVGNCFFSDGSPTGNCWSTFIASIKITGFSTTVSPSHLTLATSSSTATSTITVASLATFSGTVTLTSSISPTGPTTSVSPTSIILAAGSSGSATLTVSTKKDIAAGSYAVTVTGTVGSTSQSAIVSVTVGPDFSAVANPTTLTIQQGSSASSAINLQSLNGFTGNVTLTASILTPGPTASLNPSSLVLTSGGSAAAPLTVSTTGTTATGTYLVIVTASSGSVSHSVGILVKVRDFTISANPVSLTFPTFTTYSNTSLIRLVSLDGFSGTISLSASVSPAGLSTSLSTTIVNLSANSTTTSLLTISAGSSASPGTYTITITGSATVGGSTISHSTAVFIFIPSPDFSMSVSPTFMTVNLGSSGTFTTILASVNKFSGNVNLTSQFAPSGVTVSFNPAIVGLTAGGHVNSTVTLSVAFSTAPGVYIFNVIGTSGALSHSAQMEVIIPGFTVSANPTGLTFGISSSATSTIAVQSIGGFSQNVTLSATVSNATITNRPTATVNPTIVKPLAYNIATSTLTVSASSSTPPGKYTVTVNATTIISGRQLSQLVTVSITIPPPDFALSANPTAFSMTPGSGTSTITITSLYGLAGTVSLSVSAPGLTASVNPSSVTLSAYGTATSTLTVSGSTLGTFTASVTGTSGSLSHSTSVTVGIGGTVCIADMSQLGSSSPCPASGWSSHGPLTTPQTQLRLGVFVSGSSSLNLFGVTVIADPNILRPVSVDLTGTIIGTPAFQAACIQDFGSGCSSQDNGSTVTVTAFSYAATSSPATGLLFEITYNVTNFILSSSTPIGFQTGCSGGSVYGSNLCVSIDNGSALPETVKTATFSNLPPQPYVQLSGTPTSLGPVPAYTSATATITATSKNGFPGILDTGTVSFTITASPGLNAGLNSSSVILSSGSSASVSLTLSSAASGTYYARIYGTYTVTNTTTGFTNTLSATLTESITVTDFSVSASPTSLSFNAGSTATTTVTVKSINGFAGTVTFSALSVPTGVTVTFNPTSVTLTAGGSANSTATFSASTPNTYTVPIFGKSASDSRFTRISTKVVGFKIVSSISSVGILPGASKAANITLTSINGFTGTVSLSSSVFPSGGHSPSTSLNSTSVTLTAGGKQNSTLTISTTSRTGTGFYNVTVTGTSGSETLSVIISVCVGSASFCVGFPTSVPTSPVSGISISVAIPSLSAQATSPTPLSTISSAIIVSDGNPRRHY